MASTSYELPSGEYLFLVIIFAFVATVLNCTAAISSRGTLHYMNVGVRGKRTKYDNQKLIVRYSVDENSVLGTHSTGTKHLSV